VNLAKRIRRRPDFSGRFYTWPGVGRVAISDKCEQGVRDGSVNGKGVKQKYVKEIAVMVSSGAELEPTESAAPACDAQVNLWLFTDA